MSEISGGAAVVAALVPLIVAVISSRVLGLITPKGRLERQIRTVSELLATAGDDKSADGLRAVREHVTALYAARTLVRGYPIRLFTSGVLAVIGAAVLILSVQTGYRDGIIVGAIYFIGPLVVGTVHAARTEAFRTRTYRALRAGRPSGQLVIDVDFSARRNVRRAQSVHTLNERRTRRRRRRDRSQSDAPGNASP